MIYSILTLSVKASICFNLTIYVPVEYAEFTIYSLNVLSATTF